MTQMKEQNKPPEKELNETERANLSDAEFKTLVIRMLKKLIEYSNSIKKTQVEMKWNKEKSIGTNSGGDETGIQINNLEHKEEISIQPE